MSEIFCSVAIGKEFTAIT